MNKQSLEQWISQLDEEGYCDISDKQVEALIRGFAALETQRDQLAAENAALNSERLAWAELYADEMGDPDILDKAKAFKAQATDAFLREVRAQGVEELARFAREEYQRHKSVGEITGQRQWRGLVLLCADFANLIRKGGAA